jgi:hypothetical protein
VVRRRGRDAVAAFDVSPKSVGAGTKNFRTQDMDITLIGGPFDGATVSWSDADLDVAFPHAQSYVWYRLAPGRRSALYWPLISQTTENAQQSDAA